MNNTFYTDAHPCYIYLLVLDVPDDEPFYFVGKSFSRSISKEYSRHISGGYITTKDFFSPNDKPKLYILQNRKLTKSDAYQYIVAYIALFEHYKLGECLNHDGTLLHAEHLTPATEAIYREISQEPLAELLKRTYVTRAIEADRNRVEQIPAQEIKRLVQLNVSLPEADKASFDAYCTRLGVSRREAFGTLLSAASNSTTDHFAKIVASKDRKIEKQATIIQQLQQRLATYNSIPKKEIWASAYVPFILTGIHRYMKLLYPERQAANPIPSRPYKRFTKKLPFGEEYHYPDNDGFYLMRLQAVLWGQHKSCFYIGIGENGQKIKMRYFPKEYFLGLVPRGSGYENQGSLWLMGCRKAADGAYDLTAAFPAVFPLISAPTHKESISPSANISLADRIANIEKSKLP